MSGYQIQIKRTRTFIEWQTVTINAVNLEVATYLAQEKAEESRWQLGATGETLEIDVLSSPEDEHGDSAP